MRNDNNYQRQVWLIPIADERVGVQVKQRYPLRSHCAIPERFCGGDSLRRGAISSVCTFTFTTSSFGLTSLFLQRLVKVRLGLWIFVVKR